MNFLAIDTTKSSSYIILKNGEDIVIDTLKETRKVSENLLLGVDKLLQSNNAKLKDLDCFGCVVGPGSFTGVRIGMSMIKAFNAVLDKNIVMLNSFEVLENTVKDGCIFLTCTKTSFYFAFVKDGKVTNMGVEELKNIKHDKFKNATTFTPEKELQEYADNYINNYKSILKSAFEIKVAKKQFVNKSDFLPLYLQLSQAERNLKK